MTFGQKRPIKNHERQRTSQKTEEAWQARQYRCRFETKRGKGSHGTLYYGSRKTILKDRKKEIGPGLLSKMLAELGLDKDDMN